MYISSVIIEVTRKCNMKCDHCLRGCAQNVDISDETLENFFKRINTISNLTITGGEPSLVPEKINKIVELIKKYNIYLSSFYIATNGKNISDAFLSSVLNLYLCCDEKDMCQLVYSDDIFHDEITEENKNKLLAFRFSDARHDDHITENNIIYEGKAKNNFCDTNRKPNIYKYDYEEEYGVTEGDIYLNCKGNVLPCCDLSYESQEISTLIIGNVNKKSFGFENSIKKFNKLYDKLDFKNKTIEEIKQINSKE